MGFRSSTYREGLHQVGGLRGQALLLLDVVSHIAELLLQHTDSLEVSGVVEGVAAEQQELMVGRSKGDLLNQGSKVGFFFHIIH